MLLVRIRRSLREIRSTRKRVRLKLRPQDNIHRDGKWNTIDSILTTKKPRNKMIDTYASNPNTDPVRSEGAGASECSVTK
ncbi:hypothetical protein TNCV_4764291, partial [Trichonephila clavipes]